MAQVRILFALLQSTSVARNDLLDVNLLYVLFQTGALSCKVDVVMSNIAEVCPIEAAFMVDEVAM